MVGTVDVLVIGGGAAGIGAGLRLAAAGVDYLLVEARPRLGGRAWTINDGLPYDMGCGWLHSADENPWTDIAAAQGRTIDRTLPPWTRPSRVDLPADEQAEFGRAIADFYERLYAAKNEPDRPASSLLKPGNRWNPLLNAISTYINGAELDRVSMQDLACYHDTEINWRVREGYGTVIAAAGAGLNVMTACPVSEIDHSGQLIAARTDRGVVTARCVIVTVSSALLAEEHLRFVPTLPEKVEAAASLPLGIANKLFLSLEGAEEFEADSRVFGRGRETGTASYHMRPFGRPLIEAYFGGSLADDLEREGGQSFVDFAGQELNGILGSSFSSRLRPVHLSQWRKDPYARGSYSYAAPGHHSDRAVLARPVDSRLFFAGEACSAISFSTAHGAYQTGVSAAGHALAALGRNPL